MPISPRQEALLKRTFIDFQATSEFLKRPVIFSRAEGLYLWDIDGKRYFDAIGGIFVATLGHQHPRVMEAMRRQIDIMTFAPPLHGISDVTLDFVEKVGSVAPPGLTYVKPFSGGSEAIEAAMKFVRQYFKQTGHPGKYKFISRYHSYHGGTFGGMSASGTGSRKTKFRARQKLAAEMTELRAKLATEPVKDPRTIINEDPETVAGVLVEPIGNTGGIITPTEEYFRILRDICDRHRVILIYDEVITGFGKTGAMFAAQTLGVTPDIICSGKGLSSGALPLGVMIAREDMADAFWGSQEDGLQFAHGHTFAGNPLSAAVGIAVIDELVEKDLPAKALRLGAYLADRLRCLKKFGVVREVRGKGVLLGVEFVKDTNSMEPFPELGAALKITALENGVILRVDPSWFAVAPPLIAEEKDLDEMCDLIEKSVTDALSRVGRR